MDVHILYEDDDVLVADKPSGLIVHSDGKREEATLCDWFVEHVPSAKGVGEPITQTDGSIIERSGVVHRLDRETSGTIILAKTQEAFEYLKQQFKDRHVEKTYRTFVHGTFSKKKDVIDRPIGRSASDFRKWSAQRGARGMLREAVTEYEVLAQNATFAYLEVKPKTGRTHQIRVHLKAINHPVVRDSLYAPNHEPALGFTRLPLHAYRLSLTLPSGKRGDFEAPLPPEFLTAERSLAL